MNSAILSSLLLLSLLIHDAQGMGLIRKGSLTNSHQFKNHKPLQEKSGEDEVNSMWKSKHFSGRSRKLIITSPNHNTATIAKNEKEKKEEKSAKKEENLSINSSSTPGILDLAGMDYSQARRKPPIHN